MGALSGEWESALRAEFTKPYYKKLFEFIKNEYSTKVIYPPSNEIFTAFHLTAPSEIKVLILGQDP